MYDRFDMFGHQIWQKVISKSAENCRTYPDIIEGSCPEPDESTSIIKKCRRISYQFIFLIQYRFSSLLKNNEPSYAITLALNVLSS